MFFDSKERRGSVFVLFSYCVRCETVFDWVSTVFDWFPMGFDGFRLDFDGFRRALDGSGQTEIACLNVVMGCLRLPYR